MNRLIDYLADLCDSDREYLIRRYFYGYLAKGDELSQVIDEFCENICEDPIFMCRPKTDHYHTGLNLIIFNNIHMSIPPLREGDNSLFNLLEEDIHKNY